jgi:UDPglucose 6-dehydrogenase
MSFRYSIVGLGKLGASMAAAIASRGFPVVGIDIDPRVVERLNAGRAPVPETGLDELVAANRQRLRATTSHREAILDSDITFAVVPTPSNESGAFSLQYAAWAFGEIGAALAEKNSYHLVVLTSTVLPGATRHGLLPILERRSGKQCGRDFGLCYNPEFIALGSVVRDFLNPDFTLVGEFEDQSGCMLEAAYAGIVLNRAPCRRMSLENAELAKIALNAYVTTKITFANMLADLCERIPGGDVDVVSGALGLDARIGRKYLTGGLGYGGPCFPRDNRALACFARALGTDAPLPETTDRANRSLAETIDERLGLQVDPGTTVAILGLAYKPLSHVVEHSQGVALAKKLSGRGARVVAHDPLAGDAAAHELKDHAVVLPSLQDCLDQASIVIITTPDSVYAALDAKSFCNGTRTVTVVDCWRLLAGKLTGQRGINYVPVGRNRAPEVATARLAAMWPLV